MLLKKFTIHRYKSFLTEQSIDIEKGITRIVGKNESGKTALLESLAKTNYFEDNKNFKFDKTMDYPRGQLASVQDDNPKAVTCEYEISESTIKRIEADLGHGVLPNKSVSITTQYDNSQIISNFVTSFESFMTFISAKYHLKDEEKDSIKGSKTIDDLHQAISDKEGLEELNKFITGIMESPNSAKSNWSNKLNSYIYFNYIVPELPKYWYFSDYFNMPCRINIQDFCNNNASQSFTEEEYNLAKALFELSGLKANDLLDESNFEEYKAKLEATSNSITDDMFEYWSTNSSLEIRFDIEHTPSNVRYLNIRVYNQKHRVTLPLRNRSKGFVWFFSFLVWFSKIQGSSSTKYILLLDEPGLSLHASAQKDLLRFINDKLAPNYQVIFTTHSPFMIDSTKLNEVRTVYDTQDRKIGSIISDALEEKDSDTLFPLQAALGYTIAQNLYVSEKNLLVEGISDLVYLSHFSLILNNLSRIGLNESITIVPVGGADKIATFISLMRGNKLNTVCLLDTFSDQSAKARLDKMVTEKLISDKKIIFYHEILKSSFADIEDMFEIKEYLALYNGAFNLDIHENQIDKSKPIMNQLRRLNDGKSFNHYAPANYMAKNIEAITFSDNTLKNFENLFIEINKLLC